MIQHRHPLIAPIAATPPSDDLLTTEPVMPPLFPISAIAQASHSRATMWEGLAQASQIVSEAETRKGVPLTQTELRVLMNFHLDAYDPDWMWSRQGITNAWMAGWEHAFALAAQRVERARDPEPGSGIGLLASGAPPSPSDRLVSRSTVHFRRAQLQVAAPEDFFQGVWEGQLAALDAQPPWQVALESAPPRSTVQIFDDLLDLLYETGNHGIDFVVGYTLGLCEGLLCGRIWPPMQKGGE